MKKQTTEVSDTPVKNPNREKALALLASNFEPLERINISLLTDELGLTLVEYPETLKKIAKLAAYQEKIYTSGNQLVKLLLDAYHRELEYLATIEDLTSTNQSLEAAFNETERSQSAGA
jgi:hypothetical protein